MLRTRAFAHALAISLLLVPTHRAHGAIPSDVRTRRANVDVTGIVTDSTNGQPLPSAEISVAAQGGGIVSNTTTDGFGRFTIHNLATGAYVVSVHLLGFKPVTRPFVLSPSATGSQPLAFTMSPVGLTLEAVQVTASVPISVDTRTGDQVFKQSDFHGAPTNTTSQILQQSIVGAARAPTGEVHIRGQHAEYTFYVDGVPVPAGISGSLNELFDPEVVNQINFQTGGWDAEYGNKNAAIINVTTKVPAGGFHASLSSYAGAYDRSSTIGPSGFNGQTASASGNKGPWGLYVSGSRQFSDMRREPLVYDVGGKKIINFHNSGNDAFGFAKLQYTPGANDVVDLETSLSQTKFAVPFDSTGGAFSDDHQRDINSFVNLGWRHQMSAGVTGAAGSNLFAGVFYRHGSLTYSPNPSDDPQFIFFPDTTAYNLSESRNFNTYGAKLDYVAKVTDKLELKFGTLSSITTGHENFQTIAATGSSGPASVSGLSGHDLGLYAQTAYSPVEVLEIRAGVRYDAHNAPFAGTSSQVSPRIRLNFFPTSLTTLYGYYGRLFLPTNVEDLRAITSVAQNGTVADPTLPERDNFYEVGLVQRIPSASLIAKLSGYRKESSPGIDDNTVPGSAIVTSVNIDQVTITGVEAVLEFRPDGPFSAYANAALNHAYGHGPITGGFFPADTPNGYFDLDHDQRLSLVGTATYSPQRFFLSGTAIYGSGLTNGAGPEDCGCSYGTGLFAFNKGIHVDPSTIVNASAGYTIVVGNTVLQPQLYAENLFNRKYALKGAFFSGASVGRPRSIQLRLKLAF